MLSNKMKCIVINLERARERRNRIIEAFEKLDLEFELLVGKDKLELEESDYIRHADRESGLVNWNHPNIPGLLGCWISHQRVWQSALERNIDLVAVIEDDSIISPHVKSTLTAISELHDDEFGFDIIFLDTRHSHKYFLPLNRIDSKHTIGLVRYSNVGSSGYVITSRAMQRLLSEFPRMPVPMGQLLHASWKTGLETYTIKPQVIFHGGAQSDVNSFIDNPSQVKRRSLKQNLRFVFEFGIPKRVTYFRRANGYRY